MIPSVGIHATTIGIENLTFQHSSRSGIARTIHLVDAIVVRTGTTIYHQSINLCRKLVLLGTKFERWSHILPLPESKRSSFSAAGVPPIFLDSLLVRLRSDDSADRTESASIHPFSHRKGTRRVHSTYNIFVLLHHLLLHAPSTISHFLLSLNRHARQHRHSQQQKAHEKLTSHKKCD